MCKTMIGAREREKEKVTRYQNEIRDRIWFV